MDKYMSTYEYQSIENNIMGAYWLKPKPKLKTIVQSIKTKPSCG